MLPYIGEVLLLGTKKRDFTDNKTNQPVTRHYAICYVEGESAIEAQIDNGLLERVIKAQGQKVKAKILQNIYNGRATYRLELHGA